MKLTRALSLNVGLPRLRIDVVSVLFWPCPSLARAGPYPKLMETRSGDPGQAAWRKTWLQWHLRTWTGLKGAIGSALGAEVSEPLSRDILPGRGIAPALAPSILQPLSGCMWAEDVAFRKLPCSVPIFRRTAFCCIGSSRQKSAS